MRLFNTITILLSIALSSCSINEYATLSNEKSNGSLIKKSINDLNAVANLEESIDKNENLVILSMETSETDDSGITAQIEDELIKEFITKGYSILERDHDIINRLISESDENYSLFNRIKSYNYEREASNSNSSLSGGSIKPHRFKGSSVTHYSSSGISGNANQSSFYNKSAEENYEQHVSTTLNASDKILSYRVIECGVIYNIEEGVGSYSLEEESVKRSARTILEVRLTDSKSGKILEAFTLDGKASDEITNSEFQTLDKFGYRNYHASLPKTYGNPSQLTNQYLVEDNTRRKPYVFIIGGLGFIAILLLSGA